MKRVQNVEEWFWSKIRKGDGCWEWSGCTTTGGYGAYRVHGSNGKAHRKAWELANGPIPKGLFVCHRCDNPLCCRPDHLFLGTHSDNMRDCHAKGRYSTGKRHYLNSRPELVLRGEANGFSKLTEEQVREIRRLRSLTKRLSFAKIAATLGVGPNAVRDAALGITWRHVK